jgi:5,5'-dehydrodivanillate O-demethylase oxygenase subunit
MLSAEENATLTKVGPGTPMGRLLRWYWHPIAAATQLDENPVRRVRLLGETLVLYRNRRGGLGLIGERCAHRRVDLIFGIPEAEGLRCPYHGWLYDATGQCLEMPAEAEDSSFPGRVKIDAYPVEELAGMIFAYLGPLPAPLLPRWDLLVCDNVLRDIAFQVVPCNWLQMQGNDVDPAHVPWLHHAFADYALERLGRPELERRPSQLEATRPQFWDGRIRADALSDWQICELGIMNLTRTDADGEWRVWRPSIFPNMNSFQTLFMYRVPMDDEHTLHVTITAYPQPEGESVHQDKIPYYVVPPSVDGERGPIWAELDNNGGQDVMAYVAQGPIIERWKEKLGESDRGVILWRELLQRQLRIVEDGGEPMNVFRDPSKNARIDVPPRDGSPLRWPGPEEGFMRRVNASWVHSPVVTEMVVKHRGREALARPVY